MEKIIITTPDELKALVKEAVHGLLPAPAEQKNDMDAANLVKILAFLKFLKALFNKEIKNFWKHTKNSF